jgi:hypothetical protein
MSERHDPHAGESMAGAHGSAEDHGGTHGHDDHAHGAEALGPIDVPMWGAAVLGIALGLAVLLAFVQAAF